jgi:hypothetical protein
MQPCCIGLGSGPGSNSCSSSVCVLCSAVRITTPVLSFLRPYVQVDAVHAMRQQQREGTYRSVSHDAVPGRLVLPA